MFVTVVTSRPSSKASEKAAGRAAAGKLAAPGMVVVERATPPWVVLLSAKNVTPAVVPVCELAP
jgi:hypothetical protein